ncbi:hypothetical protein PROFUN_13710 [Planoprotostelium fungivorum]|uniref:Acireductone dioxygenase n=1 Tax=Planoprotostelium fungivorum TaxID=1890364 RepID=A0A2P6N365_9EUKA|nr:hypothetical protein PROFUN_13710 [Planoprotostelium fungivorum]
MKAQFMQSGENVSKEQLEKLGVDSWILDADRWEEEGKLDQICKQRGYNYKDEVDSRKMPDLRSKLDNFLVEHIHDDEEIRFILEGGGYFDVRDAKSNSDDWIRITVEKGDMIVLPPGIYHRFLPDDNMFFHVMRLFQGEPVWTPHNRSDLTDQRKARLEYVKKYVEAN